MGDQWEGAGGGDDCIPSFASAGPPQRTTPPPRGPRKGRPHPRGDPILVAPAPAQFNPAPQGLPPPPRGPLQGLRGSPRSPRGRGPRAGVYWAVLGRFQYVHNTDSNVDRSLIQVYNFNGDYYDLHRLILIRYEQRFITHEFCTLFKSVISLFIVIILKVLFSGIL